jgi:hypothetical protein
MARSEQAIGLVLDAYERLQAAEGRAADECETCRARRSLAVNMARAEIVQRVAALWRHERETGAGDGA